VSQFGDIANWMIPVSVNADKVPSFSPHLLLSTLSGLTQPTRSKTKTNGDSEGGGYSIKFYTGRLRLELSLPFNKPKQ